MSNLSPYQQRMMDRLKKGHKFWSTISGWHNNGQRLRQATQDALWETGELVEIYLKGRMLDSWYVCHRSRVGVAAGKKQILKTIRPVD